MYKRKDLEFIQVQIKKPRSLIYVLSGPRQVGKTTLAHQLIESVKTDAIYASADEAIAAGGDWIDGIWQSARDRLRIGDKKEIILIIDEIQKVANWSHFVKKNWDRDSLDKLNLKVVLLGSSRMLIMRGLNESLTGRFFLHYIGHWSYPEMHAAFGVSPEEYAWFGGYPKAAEFIREEKLFKEYVRNSIIEPSISKDVLMLTQVNKPALLRQLFELGSAYSGQVLSFNKILGQFQEAGNASTLANYAELLRQASLIAGLDEYSSKPIKMKASSPKFQVFDMALLSALSHLSFEQARMESSFWGRVIESLVGARLLNLANKDSLSKLYYWRDGDTEVDFVVRYGGEVLAIEVKSKLSDAVPENLAEFVRRFPGARTLLIGENGLKLHDFLMIEAIADLF